MSFYHLRIARPVSCLEKSRDMYCHGLGLQTIGAFDQHAGFSGVMLGRADMPWHLEFTLCLRHPITPAVSQEDLLILYIPESQAWHHACDAMRDAGFTRCAAFNPYWDEQGRTFLDHDGYRTVIQQRAWPLSA